MSRSKALVHPEPTWIARDLSYGAEGTFRTHFAYVEERNTQGVKYVNRTNRPA